MLEGKQNQTNLASRQQMTTTYPKKKKRQQMATHEVN